MHFIHSLSCCCSILLILSHFDRLSRVRFFCDITPMPYRRMCLLSPSLRTNQPLPPLPLSLSHSLPLHLISLSISCHRTKSRLQGIEHLWDACIVECTTLNYYWFNTGLALIRCKLIRINIKLCVDMNYIMGSQIDNK